MNMPKNWEFPKYFIENGRFSVRFCVVHDWKTMNWTAYFADTLGL